MTYGACTPQDFARFDRAASRSRRPDTLTMLCAATLTVSASVGLWALYAPALQQRDVDAAPPTGAHEITLAPAPAAIAPLRHYAALLDPAFSGGAAPLTFAQSAPLRSHFEPQRREATGPLASPPVPVASADGLRIGELRTEQAETRQTELAALQQGTPDVAPHIVPPPPPVSEIVNDTDVPMPTPRPRFEAQDAGPTPPVLAAPRRLADREAARTPAPAAPAAPGFFEKLFGKPQAPSGNTALAYAAPQDSVIGNIFAGRPAATASPDSATAVYDISAHTVYMPDGSKLEAHSGLGEAFDNPNGVHLRMRGATPPNVYELSQREALFHGVRALRLTPVGNGETYGRAGLLAHTYMLRGGTGESNGCVVFRNYAAFLRAYDNGQIKRLAVVARRS